MSKLGIVFAGGGGKGSYQIGVWRGLKLLGLEDKVSAISGTSIGALNGILFLQNDYEKGEEVWLNSSQEKMMPIDDRLIARNMLYLKISERKKEEVLKWASNLRNEGDVISKQGLIEIIDNGLDYKKIKSSHIPMYICCTEMPGMNAKYFKINDHDEKTIKNILCATTAIPMVFGSEEIDEHIYMDGGLVDNVPIKPVYDSGCDIIIVISFNREERIDSSLFPNAKIIEILPSKNMGGWIVGTLDFSRQTSLERILEGYKDVLRLFKGIVDDPTKDIVEVIDERYEDINKNLEEMIKERDSLGDGIKRLKQIKVIRSNLRSITRKKLQTKKKIL